jgi:hypothetical protein
MGRRLAWLVAAIAVFTSMVAIFFYELGGKRVWYMLEYTVQLKVVVVSSHTQI